MLCKLEMGLFIIYNPIVEMPPSPTPLARSSGPSVVPASAPSPPKLNELPDKILTDLMILMDHDALMNFIRADKAAHKLFNASKDHIFRERIRKEFCSESTEDTYYLLRAIKQKDPSLVHELCLRNEGVKTNDASGAKASKVLGKYFTYIQKSNKALFLSLPKNRRVRMVCEIYEIIFNGLTQHANPDHYFRRRSFLLTARRQIDQTNEEVGEGTKASPEVQKAWDSIYMRLVYILDREIEALPPTSGTSGTSATKSSGK